MTGALKGRAALWVVVAVQAVFSLFFVWDILSGVLGLRAEPLSWQARELIDIGAALGLLLGVVLGAVLLASTLRRNRAVEDQLHRASGAFAELLEERFAEWALTPSERDVAWFTLKGLSIAEIGRLRQTSEGTVKAQSNAIYRKAGVSGRTQLLSLFIDELLERRPADASAGPGRAERP
jgi:DNA-binding CsgD family transcriptional regulator